MGIDKSEIKILTANNIGADLEDMQEAAQRAEYTHEGARKALAEAGVKVAQLAGHIERDLEEGKIDVAELKEPLGIERLLKRYLGKAIGVLDNLHEGAKIAHATSAGMASAYKKSMGVSKKVKDDEIAKVKGLLETLELAKQVGDGEEVDLTAGSRPAGRHPGNPLAARRAAEAARAVGTNGKSTKKVITKKRVAKKTAKKTTRKKASKKG